jgi:hypothetical protein
LTTNCCVAQYEPAGDPVHPIGAKAPHRPGSARHVLATAQPTAVTTTSGAGAWLYTGPDERERELEIIALDVQPPDGGQACLLVIHVMPTRLRGEAP